MRETIAYDRNVIEDTLQKYVKMKPDAPIARGTATIQLFNKDGALEREVKSENMITDIPSLKQYEGFCRYAFCGMSSKVYNRLDSWFSRPFSMLLLSTYSGPESSSGDILGDIIGFSSTLEDPQYKNSTVEGRFNRNESSLTVTPCSDLLATCDQKAHLHLVVDFPTSSANGTFQTIYATETNESGGRPYLTKTSSNYLLDPIRYLDTLKESAPSWCKTGYIGAAYDSGKIAYILTGDTERHPSLSCSYRRFYVGVLDLKTRKHQEYEMTEDSYKDKDTCQLSSIGAYDDWYKAAKFDGINNIVYCHNYYSSQYVWKGSSLVLDLNEKRARTISAIDAMKSYGDEANNFTKTASQMVIPGVKDGYAYIQATLTTESSHVVMLIKYDGQGRIVKVGSTELPRSEYSCTDVNGRMRWDPAVATTIQTYKKDDLSYTAVFDYDCNFLGLRLWSDFLGAYKGSSEYDIEYKTDLHAYIVGLDINYDPQIGRKVLQLTEPLKASSHNRLPAPVTKTAAHTMKIQYDIDFTIPSPCTTIPDWAKE